MLADEAQAVPHQSLVILLGAAQDQGLGFAHLEVLAPFLNIGFEGSGV